MDRQVEIQNEFRQQQIRLKYYIIALCVTSIGFSIYNTIGAKLQLTQIPLAIAVFSWGISIFLGFRFLNYSLSILYANNALFDVFNGLHPKVGNNPQNMQAASAGINEAINENGERANKLSIWQERLFYFGIIMYLTWHIIEMYCRT